MLTLISVLTVYADYMHLARPPAAPQQLYFEYHFYFDGLNFGWLTHKQGRNYQKWNHTVDDALSLMRRLRQRGIRAHFWV